MTHNVHLTLVCSRHSHRMYVILFDPWTISIWLCLVVTAPLERMWFCLILQNIDLTLPCSDCSNRAYVISFDAAQYQSDSTVFSHFHRTFVILFDSWTILIWLCLVLVTPSERMWFCLIPHNFNLTLARRSHRPCVILFDDVQCRSNSA